MVKTKRKMKLKITEQTYKKLLKKQKSKRKMTKKENKILNDSMYIKYCKCLRSFEYTKERRGYPICMNSIYKQRNIKPPRHASKQCNEIYNKS